MKIIVMLCAAMIFGTATAHADMTTAQLEHDSVIVAPAVCSYLTEHGVNDDSLNHIFLALVNANYTGKDAGSLVFYVIQNKCNWLSQGVTDWLKTKAMQVI